MPDFLSPHIATLGRYDWEAYQKDESLRQLFARKSFLLPFRTKLTQHRISLSGLFTRSRSLPR